MRISNDTGLDHGYIASVLKAIGNTRRLQILFHLVDSDELSVSEIERMMPDLSQSALSQHLGKLRHANIVETRRMSQTIFYAVRNPDIIRILRLLHQIYNDN